jgi:hypothetical protein
MERGYRPNPVWLPGAMWNCSACMTSSYGVITCRSIETLTQKKSRRRHHGFEQNVKIKQAQKRAEPLS